MRKLVVTLLFATLAGALTFGAAASLEVNAQNLGSGGEKVVACQDDIAVGFSQVEGEPQHINGIVLYEVDGICAGQTVSYIVSDAESRALVTGQGTLKPGTQTILFGGEGGAGGPVDVPAASIAEVGLTIAGAPATAAEPTPAPVVLP